MKHCQSCESEEASVVRLKWHLVNSSYHYTTPENLDEIVLGTTIELDYIPRKEYNYLLEQEETERQNVAKRKVPQQPKQPPPNKRSCAASASSSAAAPDIDYSLAVIGAIGASPAQTSRTRQLSVIPLDTGELFTCKHNRLCVVVASTMKSVVCGGGRICEV